MWPLDKKRKKVAKKEKNLFSWMPCLQVFEFFHQYIELSEIYRKKGKHLYMMKTYINMWKRRLKPIIPQNAKKESD